MRFGVGRVESPAIPLIAVAVVWWCYGYAVIEEHHVAFASIAGSSPDPRSRCCQREPRGRCYLKATPRQVTLDSAGTT